MRNIAIMDTSIMSFNIGDQIIMESARRELQQITKDAFVVNMPTHSPLYHWYEFSVKSEDGFRKKLNSIDLKFVCGTNLIEKNMMKRKNSWNINLLDTKFFNGFILVGAGTDGFARIANPYTKELYNNALSHKFIHSTRDEKTKIFLEDMGFKAINTGCVTIWPLTKKHCSEIPIKKSDSVVFTITDYAQDARADQFMINILCKHYSNIFCWLQGIEDEAYLKTLNIKYKDKIKFIPSSLEAYNDFLCDNDCDYIGTRLHAGIKAMQMKKRTIIVGVDNRAKDMFNTYNINLIERNNIGKLFEFINSEIVTEVAINENRIKKFLNQFNI